jgi:Cu-Zn family superoxide dismutase
MTERTIRCQHGLGAALLLLLAGAARAEEGALRFDPGDAASGAVDRAVAVLHPVGDGGVRGVVTFSADGSGPGLDVQAVVNGLTGGRHAYHVHLVGDCTGEDGSRAGPHFHFTGSALRPDPAAGITGNLGELSPNESGAAVHRARVEGARLQGPYSILGRSVVVHAKGNDPAHPPDGAAGARLACGVIGVDQPAERTQTGKPAP